MPLDFTSTKNFRDFVLGRTIKRPNGPQTFNASNYVIQGTGDSPNVDLGGVIPTNPNLSGNRILNLYNSVGVNYIEDLNVLRFSQVLNLYPYFLPSEHNLIGIMSNSNFENESKLFQFAANNIRTNPQGPVLSRIARNTEKAINGRIRVLDALNGNTSTAINLVTGREQLIAPNYQITVSKTLPGKAIDFLEVVAGVTTPFSQIPGDYLTKPSHGGNEINYRPEAKDELTRLYQDTTGALGSLLGIQRRPLESRKPSDLLLEYTSQGQKQRLFEMIDFNTYGPNYTTTARSQNTSAVFNFYDNVGQTVRTALGIEAPIKKNYVGDERGGVNSFKKILGDSEGRLVRSPYYLSLSFESVSEENSTGKKNFIDIWTNPAFNKNLSDGGKVSGNFTWIRKNGKLPVNPIGENNRETPNTDISDTFSTEFEFTQKSLLYKTQDLLNSAGSDRTHVGNVIDQTSRFFQEGKLKISRGSEIKYIDKFSNEYAGIEYCRVWTKDNPYNNLQQTMKRESNHRKFDSSVLGGKSRVWNLNIAPMSNGNKSFENSTNIISGSTIYGSNFYAKKYMFSIENLAWKTSNKAGFTVNDLPACERGSNGGRVMWFPPYDLKITEQNTANWDKNSFLGRPEPIYTYMDTERNGTISFKVIVDHPSILNLLTRDVFKDMKNDEESDNYINAFFAGCKDLDFYELVKTYTTLDKNDLDLIRQYLNSGTSRDIIEKFKYTSDPVTQPNPQGGNPNGNNTSNGSINKKYTFYFENDVPKKGASEGVGTSDLVSITTTYINKKTPYLQTQYNDFINLSTGKTRNDFIDQIGVFGKSGSTLTTLISNGSISINKLTGNTENAFNEFNSKFNSYSSDLEELKRNILSGYTKSIDIVVKTSTSEVAEKEYNFYLGIRRANSVIQDLYKKLSKDPNNPPKLEWYNDTFLKQNWKNGIPLSETTKVSVPLKKFGYDSEGFVTFNVSTFGEDVVLENFNEEFKNINCRQSYNNKSLKITAPQAFFCREASLNISYDKNIPQSINDSPTTITLPKLTRSPDSKEITTIRPKPSIDVMKRIIMKVLSECYYFKKLEDDSPIIFNSLREKLKYFHPAFHSMTPEGLNSRLTFLNQCLRPGDTIPIKGISDEKDLNARNTSFGPPPICVLRIGDFYHSKIIIRDLNISFEDSTWDMNPEGIGIQPMLASVTLQVVFLGGHGLEKPVERLQNALSSNFYANTEMYDERSISTNTTIGGKRAEDFTKEFLEDLVKRAEVDLNAKSIEPNAKITLGTYIGTLTNTTLDYTELINNFDTKLESYFTSYNNTINECQKKYGKFLTPLLLHENFRSITGCTIEKNSGNITQTLFGEYPKRNEIGPLIDNFKSVFNTKIDNTNISDLIGITYLEDKSNIFETELKLYIKDLSNTIFDKMIIENSVTSLLLSRTNLIKDIDKFNYLIKYSGDTQINGVTATKATLSGFTISDFYNFYKTQIEWLTSNHNKLNSNIQNNTQSDYNILTDENFESILKVFLYGKETNVIDIVGSLQIPMLTQQELVMSLKSFTSIEKDVTISFDKFPVKTNTNKITYTILSTAEVTNTTEKDTIRKIFRDKNNLENNLLNFYRI
jgi:hypothetical protein